MNISANNNVNFKGAVLIPASWGWDSEISRTIRDAAKDQFGNAILKHGKDVSIGIRPHEGLDLSIWGEDYDKFMQCAENNKNGILATGEWPEKVLARALTKVKAFSQAKTLKAAEDFIKNPENIKKNIITDENLQDALEIVKQENH